MNSPIRMLQLFAEGETPSQEEMTPATSGEESAALTEPVPEEEELCSAGTQAQAPGDALAHMFRQHIQGLEEQAKALQGTFPGFDLRKELRNPVFARMTAPDVGIRVEDAYYALHRGEIQSAAMQVTAQKTAQMLSDAIRSGHYRPVENGAGVQDAAPAILDYKNASPAQRSALKKRIREATARGEKLYPGR